MIFLFLITAWVPPLVQCQRKGKYTTVRTQEEQKYQEMPSNVSKLQPLAASSGFCYCSVSASVWTGNWTLCYNTRLLSYKQIKHLLKLKLHDACLLRADLQISSETSHSQLLNFLNASLMFRSSDRRRCLKSICCLQNHSVFIWKTLSLCNMEKQRGNSVCTTISTWSNLSHVCWLLHDHVLKSQRLTVPNSKPIQF